MARRDNGGAGEERNDQGEQEEQRKETRSLKCPMLLRQEREIRAITKQINTIKHSEGHIPENTQNYGQGDAKEIKRRAGTKFKRSSSRGIGKISNKAK